MVVPRALALALASLAGCFGGGGAPGLDDQEPPPVGGLMAACEVDTDCVPAAATCCECPTFAIAADDPRVAVCDDVACEPSCPDNVAAACVAGSCALVCQPLACNATCAAGFAVDSNGCLSCACAPTPDAADACTDDVDCVRTRADCCGCTGGGADTAVAAADQPAFDAGLMCPAAPQCPGVDTCDPAAAPRCVQGRCALLPDAPAGACGRPDLPACGAGAACTVNANDQASLYGLGLCAPR